MSESENSPRRYYFEHRPPFIGTHPAGEVARESWMPARRVEGLENWHYFGWVEYPQALTFEQAWKYDLLPADPFERNLFKWWRMEDRDSEMAREIREDYLAQGREWLGERAEHDGKCQLALEYLDLIEQGYS